MPINYDEMMQSKSTGLEASYGDREVMLYALGVGFQRLATDRPLEDVLFNFLRARMQRGKTVKQTRT